MKIAKYGYLVSTGERCKNYSRNDSIWFIFQGEEVVLHGFLDFSDFILSYCFCVPFGVNHIFM